MAKSIPYSERKFDHKKQQKRAADWAKENYDRIAVNVPKGTREEIKMIASSLGISANEFIVNAINEKIDRLK